MNARIVVVLAGGVCASVVAHAEPAEPEEVVALPAITTVRYDEDYSALRATGARIEADPFALTPLKYIPLDARGHAYLSLGSEFRLRYEFYQDNLWGEGPQDDGGYVWARAMPYADVHIGPNVRAFGQLIAAYEWGDQTGISPPDEDRLDLLQAFVDVRLAVSEESSFLLRPGRQLLSYGSERLIGVRYGPNVPQPFDAAVARFETGPWVIDALYARPVAIDRGEWDDQPEDTQSVWSLYTTHALPAFGDDAGIDAYYIGYSDHRAEFAQGPGRELRHTLGMRFFGERGSFDWDVEGFYQFGTYEGSTGNGRISAWSAASNAGYTFADAPLRPRVGLKANVISGDDDPDDPDLQTFNALFPKGKYFGEIGLLGPYNLINVHASLGLHLTDKATLDLASVAFWRYSKQDGIYDNGGNVIRPGLESDARFIGTQLEALLTYSFSRELEASAAYGVFFPGTFIDESGPHEVVHFVGVELLYRF